MENLCGAWSPLSDNATIQSGGAEHICTTARKWISYFYTFTLLDTFRLLDFFRLPFVSLEHIPTHLTMPKGVVSHRMAFTAPDPESRHLGMAINIFKFIFIH